MTFLSIVTCIRLLELRKLIVSVDTHSTQLSTQYIIIIIVITITYLRLSQLRLQKIKVGHLSVRHPAIFCLFIKHKKWHIWNTVGAGIAVRITADWMTGLSGFGPRQRRKDFSSSLCVPIPALGPTQPLVQWILGVLSPGLNRGRDVTLNTIPIWWRGQEWVGAIPPLPQSSSMAWRGTALNFMEYRLYIIEKLLKLFNIKQIISNKICLVLNAFLRCDSKLHFCLQIFIRDKFLPSENTEPNTKYH
jgi:hypothetical protein